jgi:hypothetical protein
MNGKMMKVVEKAMRELVEESVMKCASWYGFNGMEAMEMLMRGSVEEKEKKVSSRSEMVLPFVGELVVETGCQGLCYNRGLFTQCPKAKKESALYCKSCDKEASVSSNGKPLLGTVTDRLNSDVMEFRDPKGRAPVAYSRIMAQLDLSRETVEAEAARLGVTILEEHFAREKKRGRPKVEKKVKAQAETVEDLLSRMVTETDDEVSSEAGTVLMSDNDEAEEGEKGEKEATSAEKEEKEAKLAAQVAEKEAKLAAQKAEKEAKAAKLAEEKEAKAAKLAEEKAEKEAKLAAQKAEKEAKVAAQKAEKEAKAAKAAEEKAEKEAKLAAEKEAKAAKAKEVKPKGEKEVKPKAKKEEKEQAKPKAKEETSAAAAASEATSDTTSKPKKVTVTRITIEGVEYLKTAENLLYNPQTKEEMGIYDPESKTIKPLPDESDDELDEEDYESDAN